MIWPVLGPVAAGLAASGLIVGLRLKPSEPLSWRELRFGEELEVDAVVALVRHAAAVRHGPVIFKTRGKAGRIRFFLGAPDVALGSLSAAAAGLLPDLLVEEIAEDETCSGRPAAVRLCARVGWGGRWPMLSRNRPELTAAGLLGVLAAANDGEALELSVRLWPVGQVERPVHGAPTNPGVMRWLWPAPPQADEIGATREKYSGLVVSCELLASSSGRSRPMALTGLHRVLASLRVAGGRRGVLDYTLGSSRAAARWAARRRAPFWWERHTLLSPPELVGLVGWPVATPAISGISYGTAPRLMPPPDLPARGRILAFSDFPATAGRPLAVPVVSGLQHLAILGPTGSGKSTVIESFFRDDVLSDRGALIVDLKGDLVDRCLAAIPDRRLENVIVLDPARGGAQPGLQLFPKGADVELTSDLILGTLKELFADSWGVRSSQYLGLGLRTLAATPGATLVELPLLFADQEFRSRALARVDDPWLKAAWQRLLALSPGDRASQLSSPLTKIEELVARARVRLVLGQSDSKLDFADVLAAGRIVLVRLPPGLLGMPATQLIAALTLWTFMQAVEQRVAIVQAERRPFFAYIDEVAVLGALPLPLDSLLERARGMGCGLCLSPQSLTQLQPALRASLMANVGSVMALRQANEDEARLVAKALPGITPSQLQHLGRHQAAMKLSLGPGSVTPVMTGTTLPPAEPLSDPDVVRQVAAERWGQTIETIDQRLAERGNTDAADDLADFAGNERRLGVRRRSS